MKIRVVMCCALLVAGCAQGTWTRPGATAYEFEQEKAQCEYEAELATPDLPPPGPPPRNAGAAIALAIAQGIAKGSHQVALARTCMTAHGWTFIPNGQRAPVTSAMVTPTATIEPTPTDEECLRRFGVVCPPYLKRF